MATRSRILFRVRWRAHELQYLLDRLSRQLRHFFVATILDRMGDEKARGCYAKRLALRCRRVDEFGRRDEGGGQTATFQAHDVMQTARGT